MMMRMVGRVAQVLILVCLCELSVASLNSRRNCSTVPVIRHDGLKVLSETEGYSEVIVEGVKEITLSCSSKVPVEFNFIGQLPNLFVSSSTTRYTDPIRWDLPVNFCYETRIKVKTNIGATGKYVCYADSQQRDTPQAAVYLYAQEGSKGHVLGAGYTFAVSISPEDRNFVIPCVVNDPTISTTLYKNGNALEHEYDPKRGYLLKVSNISDAIGLYTCQVNNSPKWDHVNSSVSIIDGKDTKDIAPLLETIPSIVVKDGVAEHKNDSIFICHSSAGVRSMQFVKCLTPTECGAAAKCFLNAKFGKTNCNIKTGTVCEPTYLEQYNIDSTENCQNIFNKEIGSAGILKCESNQNTEQTVIFYTDLKEKIVFKDAEVPLADTLQIGWIPYDFGSESPYYTEEFINVTCNASKFAFSNGFRWFFALNNGSVIDADATDLPNYYGRNDNYYIGASSVKISDPNIKKLGCRAPVLNSTDWANVSINLIVQQSFPPKFTTFINKTVWFDSEDSNQLLSCEAGGIPLPTINWYKHGTELLHVNTTVIVHNSTANLSFNPQLYNANLYNGTLYVCNATNLRGSVFQNVTVFLKSPTGFANSESNTSTTKILLFVIGGFAILLGMIVALYIRARQLNGRYKRLLKTDEQNFFKGELSVKDIEAGTQTDSPQQPCHHATLPYNKAFEVPKGRLVVYDKAPPLGSGQFGVVYKGLWQDAKGETEVACKTIKSPPDYAAFILLLEEIKILQYVGQHPNVIRLLGADTRNILKLQAYVVVEYCHFGDLGTYLRGKKGSFQNEISERGNFRTHIATPAGAYVQLEVAIKTSDLIQWSIEIAAGMKYLAEKKLVHRDLALRNVVLNSQCVAKITDFGLCKNLDLSTGSNAGKPYYRANPKKSQTMPWRWLAPESLKESVYSVHSDIWAYGITLFEIFTLGDYPYSELEDGEFLKFIENGGRLAKPTNSNTAIYKIMTDCWSEKPTERPTFTELQERFTALRELIKEGNTSVSQSEDYSEDNDAANDTAEDGGSKEE